MSTLSRSLAEKHSDLTQRVILDAAVELLERAGVSELSVRAVAKQAGISERTVFRYFANRDEFLDAVANEMSRRLDLPPHPATLEDLLAYPEAAYSRFEATAALTKAALHSELYHRIRTGDAQRRGAAVRDLIDRLAPDRSERERKLATANILYYLVATTWHYYRFYFNFSPEECVQCARMAITHMLEALGIRLPDRAPTSRRR